MRVLCLGHAAYDITVPMDGYPVENTKNRVDKRIECGGGPASNAAYLLGKWGIETWFAGVVGNDEYGRIIKREFDEVNVNTDYLELSDKFKTTSSFIIANYNKGTRTILTYREPNMRLTELDLDFEPDIILIDGQEYELSKEVIGKYPKAITVIDAGRATDNIIELAKMVDYVVCSKEFAEDVTNMSIDYNQPETITLLYKEMKKQFSKNIIITLEARGSLYEKNGIIKIMPSIKVKAIDSTGAGDIFHGAFVYGLTKNFDIEKNLKISNITGAMSVTKIGGRNSVFTKEEMKEFYYEFE